MSRRLLVIGLDGFEPSVAERLMNEGRLPALARLVRDSACVHLEHGAAKRTGLAWEHFASGRDPAAAQRWSAVDFDPKRYRCLQRTTRQVPFTRGLGVNSVVFDPPYFDLQQTPEASGLVSWGAHDPGVEPFARPAGLAQEIADRFGPYPATRWIYGFTWPSPDRTRQMGEALAAATDQRSRISRWLLTERLPDWRLGLVVVSELHSAIESLWHGIDADHPQHHLASGAPAREGLEGVYEASDRLIGDLSASCPDAALLVFSMHGMGANESDVASMALLSELLYRRQFGQGLLESPSGDVTRPLTMDGSDSWSAYVSRCFTGGRTRQPGPVRRRLERVRALFASGSADNAMDWMPASWYSPYWPRMDAFALPSFYDGQIRINLVGREAHGRVALDRYQALCDSIEGTVRECVDPVSGRSVVREVIRTPCEDPRRLGPTEADMIIVWEGASLCFQHPVLGTMGPLPYRRTGGHTGHHGVAYLSAPGIKPGHYGTRSSFDVVPTIADYLVAGHCNQGSGESFLPSLDRTAQRA